MYCSHDQDVNPVSQLGMQPTGLCYHTLQVTRYLEFKTVDGSYVVKGGKVNKVRHRHRHRGRGSNQQVVAISFLAMTFATRPAQAHPCDECHEWIRNGLVS